MQRDRVVRMPLLVDGMACPVCGHVIKAKSIYTIDSHTPWRCWECTRALARKIIALRNQNEAEDNSPAIQPRGY